MSGAWEPWVPTSSQAHIILWWKAQKEGSKRLETWQNSAFHQETWWVTHSHGGKKINPFIWMEPLQPFMTQLLKFFPANQCCWVGINFQEHELWECAQSLAARWEHLTSCGVGIKMFPLGYSQNFILHYASLKTSNWSQILSSCMGG